VGPQHGATGPAERLAWWSRGEDALAVAKHLHAPQPVDGGVHPGPPDQQVPACSRLLNDALEHGDERQVVGLWHAPVAERQPARGEHKGSLGVGDLIARHVHSLEPLWAQQRERVERPPARHRLGPRRQHSRDAARGKGHATCAVVTQQV